MAEQLEVVVNLANQKVKFEGKVNSKEPIIIDYKPPVGDGEGYTSLELLLMSLASCSATSILHLLRKMGKDISGLKVNAKGLRKEINPMSFEIISLEFIINSKDAAEADVQKAIKLSEETYCPVWDMLKNNVEIITKFEIKA